MRLFSRAADGMAWLAIGLVVAMGVIGFVIMLGQFFAGIVSSEAAAWLAVIGIGTPIMIAAAHEYREIIVRERKHDRLLGRQPRQVGRLERFAQRLVGL